MERRVTIRDIAERAGVSIGAVHCALSGKSGVSEATRARVTAIAREYGYRPNAAAASLKRRRLRIAAVFPGPTEESRDYFSFVWEGLRDYIETLIDFNVELIEIPFYSGINSQANALAGLLDGEAPDGLLTTGCTAARGSVLLRACIGRGIPAVLAGNDDKSSGRLCCVQPNYPIIGRTMAELISRQIPASGKILLLAGDIKDPSHYLVVQGFDDYMRENGLEHPVCKLHIADGGADAYECIVRQLSGCADLTACCAVNARGSVMLGRALYESGRAGKLTAVGSDLFEENVRFLKNGVFTNLLFKKPYSQAYNAAKYLTDYLIKGTTPAQDVIYVGNEVIFQSSLPMYDNGLYRMIR